MRLRRKFNLNNDKESLTDFMNYSITATWIFVSALFLALGKKFIDFLVAAVIEKHDAKLEEAVKKHFSPLETKLENMQITLHEVVSKKNTSNLRSELLLNVLEKILLDDEDTEEEKINKDIKIFKKFIKDKIGKNND